MTMGDVVMVLTTQGDLRFVGKYAGWSEDGLWVLVEHDIAGIPNPACISAHTVIPYDKRRLIFPSSVTDIPAS